jgi:hypothetical protein
MPRPDPKADIQKAEPPSPRPESKDVWCFPRHLVADIDAALARADGAGQ